jgi:hypothetical protein
MSAARKGALRTVKSCAAGAGLALAAACGGSADGELPALASVVLDASATFPTIAHDPAAGISYAAFVEDAGDNAHVRLARVASDGRLVETVQVTTVAGDAAPHEQAPPQVAIGPAGEVYVVWQNNTHWPGRRFPTSDLRFARSTDGGRSFSQPFTVNDDAGGPPAGHTFQDMIVAPDGTILVSWIDSRVRAVAGAASAMHDAHGGVPHSSGGGTHMMRDGLPGPEIRIARSTDGGVSFSVSRVVAADACPCCRTAMAAGADGSIYVAWRANDDNVRDVVVARSTDGGLSYGAPVRVHADGWRIDGCPHAGPALAVDAAGTVHVAWYTGREDAPGLFYATSRDGAASFTSPLAIQTGDWVPPSLAKLVPGGEGTLWLAWEDRVTEPARIRVARVDPRGRLVTVRGGGAGRSPALARVTEGAALVWLDGAALRYQALGR